MKILDCAARAAVAGLLLLAAALGPALAQAPAPAEAPKGDTVRPEVGKPLQAAQDLIHQKMFKEALAKIHEVDAVPNRTPYENLVIERMRGSAAMSNNDIDAAIASFEAVVAMARLPADEQTRLMAALAGMYYRQKDYAKAASWSARYLKEAGNSDPKLHDQIQELAINAHYLAGNYASASRALKEAVDGDEAAGRVPTEDRLRLLASCYSKVGDNAAYAATIEQLVAHYPKKEYWADLIGRLLRRPGFSERLEIDVLRLKLASGNLTAAGDYMVLAQLALQAGYPIEAKKVVDQGYAAGVLGKGAEADRHKRLQDLANKQAAEDARTGGQGDTEAASAASGDPLVNMGFNYVLGGKPDKGLPLMEQGLHKGNLKHPEDAKLHLGIAYALAGQKSRAVQVLQTVHGNDGTADLGRLWALYAARS